MALTYYVLDVFTERPFGGNPLAVVLGADRLSSTEMQTIAREFNLSETVFVLASTSPRAHSAHPHFHAEPGAAVCRSSDDRCRHPACGASHISRQWRERCDHRA